MARKLTNSVHPRATNPSLVRLYPIDGENYRKSSQRISHTAIRVSRDDTRMFQRVNFRPENFFSRKNFYLRRGKVKAFAYLAKLPAYFKKTINNTTNFSLYIELATK